MHQFPFVKSGIQSKAPLKLIHVDVWVPAPIVSINDFRYYLVLVDDFTKFAWVYLLKLKSDVLNIFKHFKITIENQLDLKIKIFRSDGGGEFSSKALVEFCSSQGIIHQFSCSHTPQQNEVAEREHRHFIECSLTMLSLSKLPLSYWSYTIAIAVHIINRLPSPYLHNQSP